MNLLKMLTMVLTSGAALKALSSKTGLSQKQLKMIITIALPLLIGKLTSNASSKSGATSLLGALGQHKDKKTIDKRGVHQGLQLLHPRPLFRENVCKLQLPFRKL